MAVTIYKFWAIHVQLNLHLLLEPYQPTLREELLDILLNSLSNRLRIRFRAGRTASWDQSVIGRISVIYLYKEDNHLKGFDFVT